MTSPAVDEYEFCPPKFVNGNCLCLGSETRQYDRVYCGAACPENHENYMKNLIKVGGILVMPINDQLLQIYRTSDTNWETKSVLAVSFATLISSNVPENSEPLKMRKWIYFIISTNKFCKVRLKKGRRKGLGKRNSLFSLTQKF